MNEINRASVWNRLLSPLESSRKAKISGLNDLVHYTNYSALEGIVQARNIWFSLVSEMNDTSEVIAGKEIIESLGDDDNPTSAPFLAIREHDRETWDSMSDVFRHRKEWDYNNTFVSCWSNCNTECGSHDDLMMWRTYGNEGNGVAMVIDWKAFLDNPAHKDELLFFPVFYETTNDFITRCKEQFNFFSSLWLSLPKNIYESHRDVAVQAFSHLVFILAVSHKDKSFAAEKEWRFVWTRNPYEEDSALDTFLKTFSFNDGKRLSQKLCLPIDAFSDFTHEDNARPLIKELMVGPTNSQESTMLAIQKMLQQNGIETKNIKFTKSAIPYRSQKP